MPIFIIFLLVSFAHAFTPQSKDEIFLNESDKKKAFECSEKYILFLANHYLFKKHSSDYQNICSCDDIEKLDRTRLQVFSNYRQVMTQYLSFTHVTCGKNLWLCINPTKEKSFEVARSGAEFCELVEKKIKEEFSTPFASDELLNLSQTLKPYYNISKRDWGRKACDELLPKAKLHKSCSEKIGGSGNGQAIENEQLH